ncbi:MAG: V-type ATPase subunit a family protein, partial [archaeon]|nr:V-type ATPase subunit a family protein [archaeon]
MGLFRSEQIIHLKLRLPGNIEDAVKIMNEFGKLEKDAIEFIDLTKDDLEAKKNFAPMIKRCEDMDQKIEKFMKCAKEFNQKIYSYPNYRTFTADLEKDQALKSSANETSYFDQLEGEIMEDEKRIIDLIESYQKIKENLIIELEKEMVYQKYLDITKNPLQNPGAVNLNNNSLLNIMGVINAKDDIKMNRMVLRVSHGRAMVTFFDCEYPKEMDFDFNKNEKIEKKIFMIFFPVEGKDFLYRKLLSICDLLSASRYNTPESNENEKESPIEALKSSIKEKKDFLTEAEGSIRNFLRNVCGNENSYSLLDLYRLYFQKEKMIYTNLNKCILRENFIDGEVWVIEEYKQLLSQMLASIGGTDETKTRGTFIDLVEDEDIEKPTYIYTNEFLSPFQQIVNTYGIPRYKEINPAFFNIVTFPFTFGI